jgi:hypothetical protein
MKLSNTIVVVSMIAASNLLFSQTSSENKAKEIIEKAIQAEGGKTSEQYKNALYQI